VKQAWWKRILSYFVSFSIEKQKSKFSELLEVRYSQGRYLLCTENAIYSYEDLYVNFRESFHQIDWNQYKINKVLLLGLGLGSVPLLLEKQFNKKYNYTAVEIDPKVIELAEKYGIFSLQSPIDLICMDAYEYVLQNEDQFDLIIVDIFIDTEVPTKFETLIFVEQLKKRLSKQGLLMYNRMTLTEAAATKTEVFYEQVFQQQFPNAHFLQIRGNKMLLSCD
jgi:spermidine synthase